MATKKPIFVATHPRSCSTCFERVFMTRRDVLKCIHEPFGDAFYFGPERLSSRYEANETKRIESGFSHSTYQSVLERLDKDADEGKRLFIKDMIYYLMPPDGKPASIAPSLSRIERGVGTTNHYTNGITIDSQGAPYPYHTASEPNNPSVIPGSVLKQFQFTFLIRHPRLSIPSCYRCTIPPLDKVTGFYDFMPSEAGYAELRRMFDYLRSVDEVGPKVAGQESDGSVTNINGITRECSGKVNICVVDADDLLDNPSGIIRAYCDDVGIDYHPDMLIWNSDKDQSYAREKFEKWKGFHEDAINSTELKKRLQKKEKRSFSDEDKEWRDRYGEKGAQIIRETVNACIEDYEHLKQFAIKA